MIQQKNSTLKDLITAVGTSKFYGILLIVSNCLTCKNTGKEKVKMQAD